MKLAITGATGLLGGNLAAVAAATGHQLIATRRGSSKTDHLDKLGIEWREAGLSDVPALTKAFEGCDAVFHCAAAVSIQFKITPWIVEANVDGTRNVLEAVKRAGVKRLVHCSTVGAVGLSVDGQPSDETATWNMPDFGLGDAYVTTKRQAEELVRASAADTANGVDAVIVNPTYMIGPLDIKPSSGKLVRDLMRGKVPGYPDGKNNFVDVRDVARGMLAAYEKGRRGERYILGGQNLSYKTFMDLVSQVAGAKTVKHRIPTWLAKIVGWGGDFKAMVTKKEPLLNTATIRWADSPRFIFKSDKAIRELGYTTSPLENAIQDCVSWFRDQGMLPA